MSRFYISSTYSDLDDFRSEVYKTLRRMGHDAVAMEDYVASDQRPASKCLRDVETCDVYVGVVAWRYGFIPSEANPSGTSITELEYRHARAVGKPCLTFLLSPATPWPAEFRDAGVPGQSLCAFRDLLVRSHTVSFFETATQLALLVSIAVRRWEIEAGVANPVPSLKDQPLPSELKVKSYIPGERLTVATSYAQAWPGLLFAAFFVVITGGLLWRLAFEPQKVGAAEVVFGLPFLLGMAWLGFRPCRITFDFEKKFVTIQRPGALLKARPMVEGLELVLKETRSGWRASLRYLGIVFARTGPFRTRVEARDRLVAFATALNYALGAHTLKEV